MDTNTMELTLDQIPKERDEVNNLLIPQGSFPFRLPLRSPNGMPCSQPHSYVLCSGGRGRFNSASGDSFLVKVTTKDES